jgi:hypothetical protein
MELVSEETAVIRSDFDVNKFIMRAPEGTSLDFYVNVCYGSVDILSNDKEFLNESGEKYYSFES